MDSIGVDIGVASPLDKFHVNGAVRSISLNTNGGTKVYSNGTQYPGQRGTGTSNLIGFKWSSPYMYGKVDNGVSMIVGYASDERLKRNIKSITNETSHKFLDLIKPRSCNSANYEIDGNEISCDCDEIIYGGVAQEIEEFFQEIHMPSN